MSSSGLISHKGTDGTQVWDRISRYGSYTGTVGENLSFGDSKGSEYMLSLYIDDGVLNRSHRSAITNPVYTKTGVAHCSHKSQMRGMVAIVYA